MTVLSDFKQLVSFYSVADEISKKYRTISPNYIMMQFDMDWMDSLVNDIMPNK